MAKKTRDRVFIWIIAITMAVGTLGSFFVIIIANSNQQSELAEQQELMEQFSCDPATATGDRAYPKPDPIKFDKESIKKLKIEDVTKGTGDEVNKPNPCLTVHYQGNLSDGTVFDGSYDGEMAAFWLQGFPEQGISGVIEGWQEGLQGMKEGGQRVIYVPADMAYGETGQGEIGPNEPLVFTIDLVDIK